MNTKKKIKNKKKTFIFKQAIQKLKKQKKKNFIESINIIIKLNINPKKSNHNIKGIINLPYGIKKKKKIAVFTDEDKLIKEAKLAKADAVGTNDLLKIIQKNKKKFNVIIATPNSMKIVSKLGPILGPRNLMPNLKFGTVTNKIYKCIKNIQKGQIRFQNDKYGIIHLIIGKINFKSYKIKKNFKEIIKIIKSLKPNDIKGEYIKKIFISKTMGKSISIDINQIKD